MSLCVLEAQRRANRCWGKKKNQTPHVILQVTLKVKLRKIMENCNREATKHKGKGIKVTADSLVTTTKDRRDLKMNFMS